MADINAAHVSAAALGGLTLNDHLANVYQFVLTWPIHAPTHDQCNSLAVLTLAVMGGGGLLMALRKKVDQVVVPPLARGDTPPSSGS